MTAFEALGTHYIKCCATCKHWRQDQVKVQAGQCCFTLDDSQHRNLPTLDLALCSRWEEKEDAE
jgi:hypothetical protein